MITPQDYASEPATSIGDEAVHAALSANAAAYLEYLGKRLAALAAGDATAWLPDKTVWEDGPGLGDFRVMPCVHTQEGRVFKSIKIVGTNLEQRQVPGKIAVGRALVLDPAENFVTHVVDACAMSSFRTAACAVLAAQLFGVEPVRVRVIGAGRVGLCAAILFAAAGRTRAMTIVDSRTERAERAVAQLAARYPAIAFHNEVRSAGGGDVDVLATDSRTPFFTRSDLPAQLTVSLGADTRYQAELDDGWATAESIIVETEEALQWGDLWRWQQAGLLRRDAVRPWLPLWGGGSGATVPGSPQLFISAGSALMDNLTLQYLLDVRA